jgi:APA family basic amino acid/polyamine antiporter
MIFMPLSKEEREIRKANAYNRTHRINAEGKIEKLCSRCKKWILADLVHFYSNINNNVDGLHSYCKKCSLEKQKIYSQEHKEEQKERHRKWGFGGIVTGGAIIFFTYIGFDSVSTAAEEARNPQKDIPFGIIVSLIVCTVLYVGVALVLLGMMKYTTFLSGPAAEAPVAYALRTLGASNMWQAAIIIGAVMGMLSSLLVFQYGQTRIWFAMSRDGLLPQLFSAVHKRFKTPHWSTLIAGLAVGIPAGLVDIGDAADLSNIGTLFAFVLVSLGVIVLRHTHPERPRGFRVPLVPLFPLMSVVLCLGLMTGLTVITWLRFFVWLALGLVVYVFYSRHHSEFAKG